MSDDFDLITLGNRGIPRKALAKMVWNTYCIARLSLVYRGRAIPLVWRVMEHGSACIAYTDYRRLLTQAAQVLAPFNGRVVLLADRGFADTKLMKRLKRMGWHFRIRIKDDVWIYRPGALPRKAGSLRLRAGAATFWHHVQLTRERVGPQQGTLAGGQR